MPGPEPGRGGRRDGGAARRRRGAAPVGPESILAITAPAPARRNPLLGSPAGVAGLAFVLLMVVLCLGSLVWTLAPAPGGEGGAEVARYNAGRPREGRLPPWWWGYDQVARERAMAAVPEAIAAGVAADVAQEAGVPVEAVLAAREEPTDLGSTYRGELVKAAPRFLLGSDPLGRSLWYRVLTGGGISLTIGIAAALISVAIGTVYGAAAGYFGGVVDGVMMRVVDVLYGLPYILLVVLLAVASNAMVDEYITRQKERAGWVRAEARQVMAERGVGGEASAEDVRVYLEEHPEVEEDLRARGAAAVPARHLGPGWRTVLDVVTLLFAIAAVSWLTMARVVRGQVLSLKAQPFVEAARAMGAPTGRIFARHLLPNLIGPVVVYATLAVPQAILQESFLSFLGIGVRPPLPSWGNLAAEGLGELNTYRSHWWMLLFPCLLLGLTLLALNFVGEALREALDPKRSRRG